MKNDILKYFIEILSKSQMEIKEMEPFIKAQLGTLYTEAYSEIIYNNKNMKKINEGKKTFNKLSKLKEKNELSAFKTHFCFVFYSFYFKICFQHLNKKIRKIELDIVKDDYDNNMRQITNKLILRIDEINTPELKIGKDKLKKYILTNHFYFNNENNFLNYLKTTIESSSYFENKLVDKLIKKD